MTSNQGEEKKSYDFVLRMYGDAGVGKTTFIQRHRTADFISQYTPSKKNATLQLPFFTNKGTVTFHCVENPDEKIDMKHPQLALVMCDVMNETTFNNAVQKCIEMKEKKIPVVLCASKVDKRGVHRPHHNTVHRVIMENDIQYYQISAKSNYNFEKPFMYLMKRQLGDDLQFVKE